MNQKVRSSQLVDGHSRGIIDFKEEERKSKKFEEFNFILQGHQLAPYRRPWNIVLRDFAFIALAR